MCHDSARWTIKVQYFTLAILALGSFSVGAAGSFDLATFRENLAPHFTGGESFFTMFALFFPAVIYLSQAAMLGGSRPWAELAADNLVIFKIATGLVKMATHHANDAVCEISSLQPALAGMGSTMTLVLTRGARAVVGHVGDSRSYLKHDVVTRPGLPKARSTHDPPCGASPKHEHGWAEVN